MIEHSIVTVQKECVNTCFPNKIAQIKCDSRLPRSTTIIYFIQFFHIFVLHIIGKVPNYTMMVKGWVKQLVSSTFLDSLNAFTVIRGISFPSLAFSDRGELGIMSSGELKQKKKIICSIQRVQQVQSQVESLPSCIGFSHKLRTKLLNNLFVW